jgi:hypothetical protein
MRGVGKREGGGEGRRDSHSLHAHTERRPSENTEGSSLQTLKKVFTRKQIGWHFDLELPSPRTVKK